MAIFNRIIAGMCKLTVFQWHGVLDILVDKSSDERDTVVKVFLRKKLVGAFGDCC